MEPKEEIIDDYEPEPEEPVTKKNKKRKKKDLNCYRLKPNKFDYLVII